jgi:hypothetical protein
MLPQNPHQRQIANTKNTFMGEELLPKMVNDQFERKEQEGTKEPRKGGRIG